ncbi:MAG: phosphoribosylformylglycinamidine synthase subunit PurS [candidate division Zixibacteria bacterium]|nr:phosphoribosylformylglycinamidine synthase subunit PurS [candidate division Zixibacteria bacterium]
MTGTLKKATVYVKLKDGVLDPEGKTIQKALSQMGYAEFLSVRTGRFFELEIEANGSDIDSRIDEVCSKLLANPVIENYIVEKK